MIKLTQICRPKDIWINEKYIIQFHVNEHENATSISVRADEDYFLRVKETPNEILALIEANK